MRADGQSASGRLHPIVVEDDFAGSSGEDDAGDGRRTWAHGDGDAVSAEPSGEAIGVTDIGRTFLPPRDRTEAIPPQRRNTLNVAI